MNFLKFRDVRGRLSSFLVDKNFKSLQVFPYDPEIEVSHQKTTQNIPIHCESTSGHEYLNFEKILGFIAWRFHMYTQSP